MGEKRVKKVPHIGVSNKGEQDFPFCSEQCAEAFGSDGYLYKYGYDATTKQNIEDLWGEDVECDNCGEVI